MNLDQWTQEQIQVKMELGWDATTTAVLAKRGSVSQRNCHLLDQTIGASSPVSHPMEQQKVDAKRKAEQAVSRTWNRIVEAPSI